MRWDSPVNPRGGEMRMDKGKSVMDARFSTNWSRGFLVSCAVRPLAFTRTVGGTTLLVNTSSFGGLGLGGAVGGSGVFSTTGVGGAGGVRGGLGVFGGGALLGSSLGCLRSLTTMGVEG